jgi:hypothetical protein
MKVLLSIKQIMSDFSDSDELPFFGIVQYFIWGKNGRINTFFVVIEEKDTESNGKVRIFLFFAEQWIQKFDA